MKKLIAMIMTLILTIAFTVSIYGDNGDYSGAEDDNSIQTDLNIRAKSAVLMDAETGTVLYQHNSDEALTPASVTKVMTLLLVSEAIKCGKIELSDKTIVSANASSKGGSQVYLEEGEEFSVEDLLKSTVIASANDAAVALAEYVCGTETMFVSRMNEKARALGLSATKFENTTKTNCAQTQNTNTSDVKNQQIDEHNIKQTLNKYQGMSQNDLMAELLKETNKQKQSGKLSDQKIADLGNQLKPILDSNQQAKLDEILKMLR